MKTISEGIRPMERFRGKHWDERAARIMIATAFEPADMVAGALMKTEGALTTLRLAAGDGPLPGLGRKATARWRAQARLNPEQLDHALEQTEQHGLRVVVPGDAEWLIDLDRLGFRTPAALWVKGKLPLLVDHPQGVVAVVGARAATRYGWDAATELAAELAQQGVQIVSGGAYGIDAAAHRSALVNGGVTIAVLPTGLDRAYPVAHEELFDRIAQHGLLLSELPPGAAATQGRLQARARLMAALSAGVVVVEAGARSSTFQIVREATALGRRVGAVPGPITSAASAGTNRLLQLRTAEMITSASDVVATILWGQGYRIDRTNPMLAEQAPQTSPPSSALGR